MAVKKGYKQTEVGVIPEDWEIVSLSQIARFSNGKAHEDSISDYGAFIVVNSRFISTNGDVAKYSNRCFAPAAKGNILMVMSDVPNGRAIAKCFIVDCDNRYTVNQRICSIEPTRIDGKLLFYKIDRNPYYLAFDDGVKQTNLRKNDVLTCPLAIPLSGSEQSAIAQSLSDADAWIESLEQLIAKKRQIKQGAMQELLTGKRRLPGFSGKWETKRLGYMVSTPITDGPHLTPRFLTDGVPFLSVNNLVDNKIDFQEVRYISENDDQIFSRKCKPCRGDILLGKAASVGKVGLVTTDLDFNIWSPIAMIRINNQYSSLFVYYQLQSKGLARQIALLTNSSSQGNIGMSDIEKLAIQHPCIAEQTAIATVLSDMDTEIESLESKLAKAREIKQGMMQELLTGRIRLV